MGRNQKLATRSAIPIISRSDPSIQATSACKYRQHRYRHGSNGCCFERPQAHLAPSDALAERLDAGGGRLPILDAAQMLAKRIRVVCELGELAHRDKSSRFAAGHGDNT